MQNNQTKNDIQNNIQEDAQSNKNNLSKDHTRSESGKNRIFYYIAGIFSVTFWGTTFAFSKKVVPDPLFSLNFTTIRTLFGVLFILLYIIFTGQSKKFLKVLKKYIKRFLFTGMILYSFAYIIQYYGITKTTATNQAIIGQTQTFWVVILNFIFLKKKPTKFFFAGLFLAFSGVTLVILREGQELYGGHLVGDLLSILAFAIWGSYTFSTKQISDSEKSLYVTASILLCAICFLFPLSLSLGLVEEASDLSAAQWGLLVYLGVACVGLAFILWTFALSNKNIGSEKIAILTMLQPVVGIITGAIVLDEKITLQVIFGLLLVLSGLYLANLKKEKIQHIFKKNKNKMKRGKGKK